MGYTTNLSGYQYLTTSGVVGVSAQPIIIFGYSITNSGGPASPTFINGSSGTGLLAFVGDNSQGVATQSRTIALPMGVSLYNGCYISFDSSTSAVTVFFQMNG